MGKYIKHVYKQCHPKVQVINPYIKRIKLDLEKLNSDFQKVEVDLIKVNIKKIAKRTGVLSEDVKCICLYRQQRDIML